MLNLHDELLIDMEEDERWCDLLGEVLAVLNRDGGHYQTKHGAGKAAIEGIRRYYELVGEADKVATLTTERDRYRAALARIDCGGKDCIDWAHQIARRALAGTGETT